MAAKIVTISKDSLFQYPIRQTKISAMQIMANGILRPLNSLSDSQPASSVEGIAAHSKKRNATLICSFEKCFTVNR
ncbi:Uncharacterised protein [Salmonella enterica subsp. enterica serovar Bovismorbificans]|uniref:Uncharacterized protein n=1 Tax=Salmonella enterica subsp. enterica serovar Bovismorbificans TaxID=58097 RepID=A0A655CS23_SALET|nr:Uncharacterised protein [Salmonella enterica subsp. enterica serovar Bovismorbificans]